ncbi:MAG TPA: class I SAM-dependent methyltransferase [Chitinophagaceae bacterium]|jgi:predicted O-methyltransferase YrrM|nr:class I SAM-dependent methyltransferase [Chitinophagaceae bacterium]
MYSTFQLALKYISYYLTSASGTGRGIHSPFVFDFITKVLNDKKKYEDYNKVESLRKRSLKERTILTIEDHGAGSSSASSKERSVSSIAKHAVKSKKYGQLLYRMAKYYQADSIIELGTSLGITTSYLSFASPKGKVFTLEGSNEVANVARQNFKAFGLQRRPDAPRSAEASLKAQREGIHLIEGNFDYTLPSVLYQVASVDLAFIDGNHRREPTKNYFHWLLEKANSNSIFVFDDIHWSEDMEQAWEHIKQHPAARCSIDLFFIGIIFFRQEFKEKQHFTIRF